MSNQASFPPCPSCHGDDIVLVPGATSTSSNLRSGVAVGAFRSVVFDRVVCLQCGSVREWVTNRQSLDLLRKKYGNPQSFDWG
jgi:hypothetical protein